MQQRDHTAFGLLFSIFVISTCGLVYELVSGALASYLLGDSVTQFSIIIGVYLFSMGVGSHLSKYITRNVVASFIQIELLIGIIGGSSAAILFLLFETTPYFRVALYSLISMTGVLVGVEIPLIMRILKDRYEFKELVSRVFTFDYVGALFASLLFPLILVPRLGLIRSSFMFGIINIIVALWVIYLFRDELRSKGLSIVGIFCLAALAAGFVSSDWILRFSESLNYEGNIVYARNSLYQRIVITRQMESLQLYLNGNLQFNSRDEYRYHEALVHPGLQAVSNPENVLVLGGGDGLAVREILKYDAVKSVTLVDLDREMTDLFTKNEMLLKLNKGSLLSPKVGVINDDAFVWMKGNRKAFNFITVDFPDPTNYSIGKLYSLTFFRLLYGALTEDGVAVIQSTSPFVAKRSFWSIVNTLKAAGFYTTPYHCFVPSFGDWGYVIASKRPFVTRDRYIPDLRFVSTDTVREMMIFPKDMIPVEAEVNRLNNQVLVRYFEEEWAPYAR